MGYDIATTRGLVKVHAQYKQAFPINRFLRDRYFGNAPIVSKFPFITIETTRKGRKVATQIRRGEGPIEVLARDGHARSIYEAPYFSEKSAITAEDLTKFSYGESLENPYDSTTKALMVFAEKQNHIEDRFSRTEELQASELLITGKVKMVDGSFIVFGTDSELIGVKPTVKWNTTGGTGVSILGDVKKWMFLVRKKCGMLPNEIIVSPDVHELIVNDPGVQKLMDVRNYDFGRLTAVNLDGVGGVTDGGFIRVPGVGFIQILVYAESYDDEGTITELFPAGTLVMANSNNLGRMSYAATEGPVNGLPGYIPGSRSVFVTKAEGDSSEAAVTVKMAPLVQPISLDTWLSANVLVSA